jgi:hypothetical protein
MQFAWSELITRARVYKDDDHDEEPGWLDESIWLTLFNVEYAQLYPEWVRKGLVGPPAVDYAFTGPSTVINAPFDVDEDSVIEDGEEAPVGVLAIIGVAQDLGDGQYRVIQGSQADYGRAPIRSDLDSTANSWEAHGVGDLITIQLYPQDTQGNYFVRYIPRPNYATEVSETVELPYGGDERLVLGVARRAGIKDKETSALLERLLATADSNLAFLAAGRQGGLRVMARQSTPRRTFPRHPMFWRFV